MNTRRVGPRTLPYEPADFAEKHGLSLKTATTVLMANAQSREQADTGAEVFKRAKAERSR